MNIVQQRAINGVGYEMLPSTSIAVNRTMERQFFQKSVYGPGQESLIDVNTGAKYLNNRRSYLTFSVQLARTATDVAGPPALANAPVGGFGTGACTNLIRRVVVTTRSGVELCRTEDFNVLSAKTSRYDCDRDYLEQFGQLLGYIPTLGDTKDLFPAGAAPTTTTSLSGKRQFVIPLTMLSPVFQGDGKTLLPPQAAAGLRIQITWESAARAFVQNAAGTAPTDYIIDDISIMANTTTMVDAWQKALNAESAAEGLTYTYPTWYTTTSTLPAASDRINVEQRKAVARALSAFTVYTVGADSTALDNMASQPYTWDRVEWRLGSLYPTQQPIVDSAEGYFVAQNAFDAGVLDCKRMNAVSLDEYKDTMSVNAVTLERSDVAINGVLNISGLSTNNSQVLAFDGQLAAPAAAAGRLYVFMKHISMVKLYLDNSSLSV